MSRELLKQALEALKGYRQNHDDHQPCDAEKAIETFLAQPEPEPVAWMSKTFPTTFAISKDVAQPEMFFTPLYTAPPDQSAQIAELKKDNNITHENLAWYMEKYHEHLIIIEVLRDLLIRYRNETPIGHQPHMIAHEVDNALAAHSIGTNHD